MPTTKEKALEFVNKHCSTAKLAKYEDYGTTNFISFYQETDIAKAMVLADMQKSWARSLKNKALGVGGEGGAHKAPYDIYYTAGGSKTEAPTLVDKGATGAKTAKVTGYGQCNYFSDICYNLLKMPALGALKDVSPIIQKVSTSFTKKSIPGHLWILVNGDAASKADWVVVDFWLHLLGIPLEHTVCAAPNATVKFHEGTFKLLKTYNPNTGTETTER